MSLAWNQLEAGMSAAKAFAGAAFCRSLSALAHATARSRAAVAAMPAKASGDRASANRPGSNAGRTASWALNGPRSRLAEASFMKPAIAAAASDLPIEPSSARGRAEAAMVTADRMTAAPIRAGPA